MRKKKQDLCKDLRIPTYFRFILALPVMADSADYDKVRPFLTKLITYYLFSMHFRSVFGVDFGSVFHKLPQNKADCLNYMLECK